MKLVTAITITLFCFQTFSQEDYKDRNKEDTSLSYWGNKAYKVKSYAHKFKSIKPKNVILMIGDGMGVAQIFAGMTANKGHLFIGNFKHIGFSRTQSADNYITDSAAGATALSTGIRTYNGAVGVDKDTIALKTVLELAEIRGLSTGLVSTSSITHATPASFIAHQKSRTMYEDIAADFLKTDIDVFIGGGYKHFTQRKDSRNLVEELKSKGYLVSRNIKHISKVKSGKLAGLTALEHNGRFKERGNYLSIAAKTAIQILKKDKEGFFLMVEGSQIDWGSHQNNTVYTVEEMLDFDQAIGQVLEFAARDGETLIVITADHETGGLSITNGNMEKGDVKGVFGTGGHTSVMVPIFAYGPGAENFIGIMDNVEINHKIEELLFD